MSVWTSSSDGHGSKMFPGCDANVQKLETYWEPQDRFAGFGNVCAGRKPIALAKPGLSWSSSSPLYVFAASMDFGSSKVVKPAGRNVLPMKTTMVQTGHSGLRRLKVYPARDISFHAAYVKSSVLSFPYFAAWKTSHNQERGIRQGVATRGEFASAYSLPSVEKPCTRRHGPTIPRQSLLGAHHKM